LFEATEAIQKLLPANPDTDGEFAVGKDFSNADAAIAPFLARWEVSLSNDIGAYDEGEGKKVWEVLSTEPRFERFRRYLKALKERESVKKTFDKVSYNIMDMV